MERESDVGSQVVETREIIRHWICDCQFSFRLGTDVKDTVVVPTK